MIETVPALLERHLAERPDRVAFLDGDRRITYGEFAALCGKTAAWLADQGIGPGDRVAVWLVNRIEWLALFFGLARVGAALVALNTRYRAAELQTVLDRSGARMLVLRHNFRKIDFPAVLQGVDAGAVRALERVAVVDSDADTPSLVLGKPTIAFRAFEHRADETTDHSRPDAPVALFTTSGTTKGPKLVVHSQRTIAFHSHRAASAFGFEEPGACLLGALPFCGVYGFNSALAAFAAGAPVVLMETFEAGPAVDLIRRHRVTHAFGSDEMYRRILELAPGHDPFPSVRLFGFAAFNPGAADFARAAWDKRVPLVGLYGSSEVQALFSLQRPSTPLPQRIEGGGWPVAGSEAEIRIRDIDTGDLLPPERSGEIEIRAPSNFVGYWNNPDATAEAVGRDGFFRTGDIGRLRADGTFAYETRRGDAVRLGGYLVSPAEIEEALKRIPGVDDVQVVAVEIAGQPRCVAFIVPAAGAVPREADVIAAAAARMAAFKVPSRVWFVDGFPTAESPNGLKIQRARLREMALERLGQGGAA